MAQVRPKLCNRQFLSYVSFNRGSIPFLSLVKTAADPNSKNATSHYPSGGRHRRRTRSARPRGRALGKVRQACAPPQHSMLPHALLVPAPRLVADRKMHRPMVPPRGRMGTAPAVASDGALEALDQGAPGERCAKRVPPASPTGVTLHQQLVVAGPRSRRTRWNKCERISMSSCNSQRAVASNDMKSARQHVVFSNTPSSLRRGHPSSPPSFPPSCITQIRGCDSVKKRNVNRTGVN